MFSILKGYMNRQPEIDKKNPEPVLDENSQSILCKVCRKKVSKLERELQK